MHICPSLAPYMHWGHKAIDERFQSCTGDNGHHNITENHNFRHLIFLLISVALIGHGLDALWNSGQLHFVNCPSYIGVNWHHHSKCYLFEAICISLLHLLGWWAPVLACASEQGMNVQFVCINWHMHTVGFEHLIYKCSCCMLVNASNSQNSRLFWFSQQCNQNDSLWELVVEIAPHGIRIVCF